MRNSDNYNYDLIMLTRSSEGFLIQAAIHVNYYIRSFFIGMYEFKFLRTIMTFPTLDTHYTTNAPRSNTPTYVRSIRTASQAALLPSLHEQVKFF